MTADEIVTGFAQRVHALSEQLSGSEVTGLDAVVGLVRPLLSWVGRMLVALLYEQWQQRQGRPVCPHCGRLASAHGQRPRTVLTLVGEVRLRLARFRCRACGQELSPVLAGCREHPSCTREVCALVLELAARLPYRTVEQFCGRVGLPLSDDLVATLVARLGGGLAERKQARAQALATGAEPVASGRRARRLYLLVDGRMVRVEGQWRELKVGLVFETEAAEPDAHGRWPQVRPLGSYACLGGADEFMAGFAAEAVRWGVWQAQEVVLLADGAPWIWERLPHLVPVGIKTVQILDYYHAAEHVRSAVEAVLGAERGRFLGQRLADRLRVGELDAVLRSLRDLQPQASVEARHTVRLTVAYLLRHRDRCQYFRRHWEGYYIGSGRVESVCKQLGLRFKGCGMNWSHTGLTALLAVYNNVHSAEPVPWPAAA